MAYKRTSESIITKSKHIIVKFAASLIFFINVKVNLSILLMLCIIIVILSDSVINALKFLTFGDFHAFSRWLTNYIYKCYNQFSSVQYANTIIKFMRKGNTFVLETKTTVRVYHFTDYQTILWGNHDFAVTNYFFKYQGLKQLNLQTA